MEYPDTYKPAEMSRGWRIASRIGGAALALTGTMAAVHAYTTMASGDILTTPSYAMPEFIVGSSMGVLGVGVALAPNLVNFVRNNSD